MLKLRAATVTAIFSRVLLTAARGMPHLGLIDGCAPAGSAAQEKIRTERVNHVMFGKD